MPQENKALVTITIHRADGYYFAEVTRGYAVADAKHWTVGHKARHLGSELEAYREVDLAMTRPHMRDDPPRSGIPGVDV